MTTGAQSRSPSMAEVIRAAIDTRLQDVHVALPGRVEKYDAAAQKADIKPMIKRRLAASDGEEIVESIPVIPDVPVLFPRSGAFFLSFPLQPGDHVLLVFCERSIDTYMVGTPGVEADPDDFLMHELSDAVALPGCWPFARSLASAHPANMAMGHDTGAQVHIDQQHVHLGAYPGADYVALAAKVLTELNAVKADLVAVKSTFDTHTHILAIAAAAGVGGTGTAASPAVAIPAPHNPASVAATKAKAT